MTHDRARGRRRGGGEAAVTRPRIAVFGPYSSKNLGDTAIQMAVMSNLRARCPTVEFIGICHSAEDTLRTHGILAYPLSGDSPEMLASLRKRTPSMLGRLSRQLGRVLNIYRIAGSVDLLLISGSGQLDDHWGGPWANPYAMLVWSALVRLRGGRVAILGIGLDQLSTRLGRAFCLAAIRLAEYRRYRDQGTLAYLEATGLKCAGQVCPDLAFSLPEVLLMGARARRQSASVVMICPISDRAWSRQPGQGYREYLETIVELCCELVREGRVVRLANSQLDLDGPLIHLLAADLRERLGPASPIEVWEAKTVAEYVNFARQADLVIASRLHAVILALVAGTPVVAVSYARKVRQLMIDAGWGAHCVEISRVTVGDLKRLADDVLSRGDECRELIAGRNRAMRAALDSEYDDVLSLLS